MASPSIATSTGEAEIMKCQSCGTPLEQDLFSYVTGEKVCSICKINFLGGLSSIPANIQRVRAALGLGDGEFLKQDRADEARKILGR